MPARDYDDDVDDTSTRRRRREREDDDEPDDRPRKKKKGKRARKPQGLTRGQKQLFIFGGIGAAVLLVMVVGGVFALLAMFPPPDKTINGVGWYMGREDVNHTVTAYFPGRKPEYEKHGMKIPDGLARMANATSDELSWNIKTWDAKHDGREYAVLLWTFPSKGSQSGQMDAAILGQRVPAGAGVQTTEEQITFSGRQARRIVTQGKNESCVYVMVATGDSQMCCISVSGKGQFDHTDPMVTTFFDNVMLK